MQNKTLKLLRINNIQVKQIKRTFFFIFWKNYEYLLQKQMPQKAVTYQSLQQQTEQLNKLGAQQQKLSQYIEQFKCALTRQSVKKQQQTKQRQKQQEQKIEKQLEKQLENAKSMLKNYQHQLKQIQKKSLKMKYTTDDLLKLEQEIHIKQIEIKEIQEQIKDLKIVKRKQQKIINKKQKHQENGQKLAKLIEQIRKQKELLDQLKIKTQKKQETINKKIKQIQQIQKKYIQKCRQSNQQPINYQEFKQNRKKRQDTLNKSQSKQKSLTKKIITVKQMISSQFQTEQLEPTQKNLKLLKRKKQIAEDSLAMASVKDKKQIQQLRLRLQRLKNENLALENKLAEKIKQKQITQKMGINPNEKDIARLSTMSKDSILKRRNQSIMSKTQSKTNNGVKLEPI